jgi:hypothetical protein
MTDKPRIYLILGAADSGRRDVVADLIEGGAPEGGRPAVLLSENEPPAAADAKFAAIGRWRWTPAPAPHLTAGLAPEDMADVTATIEAELPEGASPVFFVTDGRLNPVDQVEAFKAWLASRGAELARILCVVNCRLAELHPPLLAWYDACIHFADVVLLNRREGVANKWLSDFQARYKDRFYPCLFELVKSGRVRNPALILEPQALRISHVFDEDLEWLVVGDDEEEGEEPEDDEDETDEEVELEPEQDPYLARRAGGLRARQIPDISKFAR